MGIKLSPAQLVSSCLFAAVVLLAATAARADGQGLKATWAPDNIRINGVAKEWTGTWVSLDYPVDGSERRAPDLAAKATIAYDDQGFYVAAVVTDDKLVGGGDHVELLLGIPGGTLLSLKLYPGVKGRRAEVKSDGGRSVRGAKIVEAPTEDGYVLEALIPWSNIPSSGTIRVGYRGALFVHDADRSSRVEGVMGTAPSRAYGSLPPLSTEPELGLGGGLLRQRNIQKPPAHNLLANVAGDAMMERVLVYQRYLIVLGPGFRQGEQYYFRDLGTDAYRDGLQLFEVRDLTGDGRDEIILRKRLLGSRGSVDVFEVLSFGSEMGVPQVLFAQEVRLEISAGSIENEIALERWGGRTRIKLSRGQANGLDPARFPRASSTGAPAVLLPWGEIDSQIYELKDGRFVMTSEKTRTPSVATHHPTPPTREPQPSYEPPSVSTGPGKPGLDQVYELYRKDRGVTGRARFDLQADLGGDRQPERLLLHGRDLVVFGPGFRDGLGYGAMSLSGLEERDIKSVKTRDLTGDGKHEVVVEGVMRSPMPPDIGSGEIEREVVLIYKLRGVGFERIFAAEIGRRIGQKRITGKISYLGSGRGTTIELRPGSASGYDEQTYPWRQNDSPSGGFEPLLLPWGGIPKVRCSYDGQSFTRR